MSELAQTWFESGERVECSFGDHTQTVFRKVVGRPAPGARWVTFLPGWPDGSYGYSHIDAILDESLGPRLYLDFVGHGDSDKPREYPYGSFERADLVEATWRELGIESTAVVCMDYSVVVALELLARRRDRAEAGEPRGPAIENWVLMNGGLFAEGHTHNWYSTPVLKSFIARPLVWLGQKSRGAFLMFLKPVFSDPKSLPEGELHAIYDAIARRDGVRTLPKTAHFVDEHLASSERLDFAALQPTAGAQFDLIWSPDDSFEGKQLELARERLDESAFAVTEIPGGHLSTVEQPELVARAIERALS